MLPRIAGLALAALLVLPGAALAAEPKPAAPPCPTGGERCVQPVDPGGTTTAPTGRYFYIAAIDRNGNAVKVEGKLWIEGEQLGASVGCNSIGAKVTFDGRTLTIREAATMTEMACEGRLAEAERALLAALTSGPFAWNGSAFTGKDVTISASEVGTAPATPPDGAVSDPNAPVGKPVEPGVIEPEPGLDLEACRSFIPEKEWEAVFGGPGSGSGNVGSGSGGSTGGNGGREGEPPPVVIDPAPAAPPIEPTGRPNPSTPEPRPSTGTVDPDPTPAPTGGTKPDPKPKSEPKTQPTDGTTSLQPTTVSDQPVAVDLPATTTGEARRLPLQVTDGPTPTPSAASCRELFSRIRTMTAGGAPAILAIDSKAEAASARDLAADRASNTAVDPLLAALLVLVGGGFMVAWLRTIPGRRETS